MQHTWLIDNHRHLVFSPVLLVLSSCTVCADHNPGPIMSIVDMSGPARQQPPEVGRPLNVNDALNYLDDVKTEFQESPDRYDQFLDIMKDFKNSVIDTHEVVQRISRLFHGHPSLIVGFNTFLPVGYRIDVSVDPLDPNAITITTPLGTTTQSTNINPTAEPTNQESPVPPEPDALDSGGIAHGDKVRTVIDPKGFKIIIRYLDKVKARYGDDSDTYQGFLNVLQMYHGDETSSHDVCLRVQTLFKDEPDLFEDFKDFIGESSESDPEGEVQSSASTTPRPDSS